jgi:hypothetical protein
VGLLVSFLVTWAFFVARADTTVNETNETQLPYLISETRIEWPNQKILSSCVLFARYYTGRQIFGNANTLHPDKTSNPKVGDWVIFWNHVAVIVDIRDDSYLIKEANYFKCALSEREIKIDDPKILGFK